MTLRHSLLLLGGLVLGSATVVPATATAQVPVTKERPTRPPMMPRDTMMARDTLTRVDTVEVVRVRVDTLYRDNIVMRMDTVVVTDTIYQVIRGGLLGGGRPRTVPQQGQAGMESMGMQDAEPGNFYGGIGGGVSFPSDGLDVGFDTGWNVKLIAGYTSSALVGFRFEAAYNQFGGSVINGVEIDEGSIWSGILDLSLNLFGDPDGTGVYVLGGGGVHGFSGYQLDALEFQQAFGDGVTPEEAGIVNETETAFGVNAGGGLRFGLGGARLFLEGKWVRVFADNGDLDYFPVSLGFAF